MPGILTGLLIWCPAIVGWGIAVRRLWGTPVRRTHLSLSDVPAGYLGLTGLAFALNFVVPLDAVAAAAAAAVGWGFAVVAYRGARARAPLADIAWLGGAALLVACIAAQPVHYGYDAGLYHLQTMQWAREQAVVPGLANLAPRFGFNSGWLALAALVTDPFDPDPLRHAILLPGTAFVFLVPAVRNAVREARGGSVAGMVGICGALAIASVTLYPSVNSTPHDLVPLLAWIGCVALVVRMLERPDEAADRAHDIWRLVAFAIVSKLSAVPLVLVALLATAIALRTALGVRPVPLIARLAALPAVVGLLWAARGIALSGCAVFPANATCIPDLPWTVPAHEVRSAYAEPREWTVFLFATEVGPRAIASVPEWVPPMLGHPDIAMPLALVAAALIVGLAARTGEARPPPLFLLGGAALAGILFWIGTAPDPRFGAGQFWALGLAAIGAALWRRSGAIPRAATFAAGAVVLVVWLPFATEAARLLTRPLRHPGLSAIVTTMHIPIVDDVPTRTVFVTDGDSIRLPVRDNEDRCYLAPLPCAPSAPPSLVILRDAGGAITGMRRQ